MDTEYLVVDDNTQGKEIKHIREVVPDISVAIFSGTLGVETIRLCDSTGLVVSSNQMNALGVSQLQTNEQGNCFDAEKAAIDVVTYSTVIALYLISLPTKLTYQEIGN